MQLDELMLQGLHIECGPHDVHLDGYYFTLYDPRDHDECSECENTAPMNWECSGHGSTPEEAFANALEVHRGIGKATPISAFKES